MNQASLEKNLAGLPLGAVRYFEQIGSTNAEAQRWVEAGAPDLALVVAGEQTAGRGRAQRTWFSPPGSGLAFSLVLRTTPLSTPAGAQLAALGALGICTALDHYDLQAAIKWPNDVLLEGRKVGGILVEAAWQAERLQSAVLGVGINLYPSPVLQRPELIFPATWVAAHLKEKPLEPETFLHDVLQEILAWRSRLGSPAFLQAWEERLAYQGEWVRVIEPHPDGQPGSELEEGWEGQLSGLTTQGELRVITRQGDVKVLQAQEIRLRPSVPGR